MTPIDPKTLDSDPIKEFQKWFVIASKIEGLDADAMTLATATKEGKPSARMVLFKDLDHGDFLFYTNYNSDKGKALTENPYAALVFYWHVLYQQIRIEGSVEKVSTEISDKYFQMRERESRISAIASHQSSIIKDRNELLKRYREVEEKFKGKDVTRPPNWGGYRVKPSKIEFWIGQPNRLHDRVCYTLEKKMWKITYLSS